jgi:hypothetical protein
MAEPHASGAALEVRTVCSRVCFSRRFGCPDFTNLIQTFCGVTMKTDEIKAVIKRAGYIFLGIQSAYGFGSDLVLFGSSNFSGVSWGIRVDQFSELNMLLAAASSVQRYRKPIERAEHEVYIRPSTIFQPVGNGLMGARDEDFFRE